MARPTEESLVIDDWAVPDGNQQELIAGLRGLYEHLRRRDGFIEGQIYESVDRTRVLSFARFRSAADRQRAFKDPAVGSAERALQKVACEHLHMYEPIEMCRPPSEAHRSPA